MAQKHIDHIISTLEIGLNDPSEPKFYQPEWLGRPIEDWLQVTPEDKAALLALPESLEPLPDEGDWDGIGLPVDFPDAPERTWPIFVHDGVTFFFASNGMYMNYWRFK